MINIANPAEEFNSIPTASRNNFTASSKSIPKGSASESSDEDEWIKFNPEIARKSDITFAVICYGIYLWIKTPAKKIFQKPTIDDKPAAFRSARQLESEYPWWDHSTILNAINRGEKALKGQLLVDRERTPLHFAMLPKLMKMHNSNKGFLVFLKSDAIKYGAWPAVLLSNLRHQLGVFNNPKIESDPVIDDNGNKYGELSPTKLTELRDNIFGNKSQILPITRDRANDAIAVLINKGAIIQHPTRTGFYRLPKAGEITGKVQKRRVGKLDSTVGKVNTTVGKVNSKNVVCVRNVRKDNKLCTVSETLDSNIDTNEDTKCLLTPTSPLRSHVVVEETSLSFGAKKLNDIIKEQLIRQRDKAVPSSKITDYAIYDVVDQDTITLIGYDCGYNWMPVDPSTGKLYSRANEINEALKQIKWLLMDKHWKYTKDDILRFREMFEAHSLLTYEHIEALLNFTSPQTNPAIWENKARIGKGHDWAYFARRIRSVKQFFKYLPQLVREYYMEEYSEQTEFEHGEDGMPICEYHQMPSPFMKLAFDPANEKPEWNDRRMKTPTTYRKEGAFIVTTYGHCGEVITLLNPIDNGTDYRTPIMEYRSADDVLENPVP